MFGAIFLNLAVARFCRVLGTLLGNGVPILKSLDISRNAAGNRILSTSIEKASQNITAGEKLATPLAASGHFPAQVTEMIAVAEESNSLDKSNGADFGQSGAHDVSTPGRDGPVARTADAAGDGCFGVFYCFGADGTVLNSSGAV